MTVTTKTTISCDYHGCVSYLTSDRSKTSLLVLWKTMDGAVYEQGDGSLTTYCPKHSQYVCEVCGSPNANVWDSGTWCTAHKPPSGPPGT